MQAMERDDQLRLRLQVNPDLASWISDCAASTHSLQDTVQLRLCG
jgi:hypothetical protein